VDVAAGGVSSIVVELPAAPLLGPRPPPLPPRPYRSAQRTAGWISLGLSAVFSGVTVATGVAALSARNTFLASGDLDRAAHDRAASLRTWTNVVLAAAAATGIAGIALVVTAPSRPRASATFALTPGAF
jgi:hypothetical protein